MLVVEFDSEQHNYLIVQEEPYFLLRISPHECLVTRAACPHRGGPLNLGKWDFRTHTLTCPWHGMCLTKMALESRSVPSVRSENMITVIFPLPEDTPVEILRRMVITHDHTSDELASGKR